MSTKRLTNSLPQSNSVWLEFSYFEFLCFNLARDLLDQFEPIPEFITRNPGTLESCLDAPKQTFGKRLLYPTLTDQAAILFYLLVKNHPFQNGNKRIALTALLVFLSLNKKWLKVGSRDLYILAIDVAGSGSIAKDQIIDKIKKFIDQNITDLD